MPNTATAAEGGGVITAAPEAARILDELKQADERLYRRMVTSNQAALARNPEMRRALVGDANSFVNRLERAAAELDSVSMEEYSWLTDTALRWEVIYASIFNTPKQIVVSLSPERLRQPDHTRVFTAEDVRKWIDGRAYELSKVRKVRSLLREVDALQRRIPSTEEEMRADWRNAQVDFTSDVLSGKINFVRQFASSSYPCLEQVWLHELKQHRAFLIWEERGCPWSLDAGITDYYAACEQLAAVLVGPELKGIVPDEFAEARAFLELNYLSTAGSLDSTKRATREMLKRKAAQVFRRGGNPDAVKNWQIAETYARRFYGNIVSAAVEKNVRATRQVLDALHQSESSHTSLGIANTFEAALAVYFLDPDAIHASGGDVWL